MEDTKVLHKVEYRLACYSHSFRGNQLPCDLLVEIDSVLNLEHGK